MCLDMFHACYKIPDICIICIICLFSISDIVVLTCTLCLRAILQPCITSPSIILPTRLVVENYTKLNNNNKCNLIGKKIICHLQSTESSKTHQYQSKTKQNTDFTFTIVFIKKYKKIKSLYIVGVSNHILLKCFTNVFV